MSRCGASANCIRDSYDGGQSWFSLPVISFRETHAGRDTFLSGGNWA